MSDFKKIYITFSNFKLQKCDVCQNGVEFCHKPIGDDVKPPSPTPYPTAAPEHDPWPHQTRNYFTGQSRQ